MKDGLKKFYKELKNDLYHIRKNINYIHDLSGKLYIVIVFDMLFSMFRYGISDNEYREGGRKNINKILYYFDD